MISLSTLRAFDKFISALAAVGGRVEVARRWLGAAGSATSALWARTRAPHADGETGARTSARGLGHSQAGAPGGWGTHRRAAFSSPSWIAGRFECFLRMRHLPKVGE